MTISESVDFSFLAKAFFSPFSACFLILELWRLARSYRQLYLLATIENASPLHCKISDSPFLEHDVLDCQNDKWRLLRCKIGFSSSFNTDFLFISVYAGSYCVASLRGLLSFQSPS